MRKQQTDHATTTASIMSFTYDFLLSLSTLLLLRRWCPCEEFYLFSKESFSYGIKPSNIWRMMGKIFQWIIHRVKWLDKPTNIPEFKCVVSIFRSSRILFKCDQLNFAHWVAYRVWCHNNHISTNHSYVVDSFNRFLCLLNMRSNKIRHEIALCTCSFRFRTCHTTRLSHYWPEKRTCVDLWLEMLCMFSSFPRLYPFRLPLVFHVCSRFY